MTTATKLHHVRCRICKANLFFPFLPQRPKCCDKCSEPFDPATCAMKARRESENGGRLPWMVPLTGEVMK